MKLYAIKDGEKYLGSNGLYPMFVKNKNKARLFSYGDAINHIKLFYTQCVVEEVDMPDTPEFLLNLK